MKYFKLFLFALTVLFCTKPNPSYAGYSLSGWRDGSLFHSQYNFESRFLCEVSQSKEFYVIYTFSNSKGEQAGGKIFAGFENRGQPSDFDIEETPSIGSVKNVAVDSNDPKVMIFSLNIRDMKSAQAFKIDAASPTTDSSIIFKDGSQTPVKCAKSTLCEVDRDPESLKYRSEYCKMLDRF